MVRGSTSGVPYDDVRRRSSAVMVASVGRGLHRTRWRTVLIVTAVLATLVTVFVRGNPPTREHLTTQIQKLQQHAQSAAKNLVSPWKDRNCHVDPDDDAEEEDDEDSAQTQQHVEIEDEAPNNQYPPLLHAPLRGYGALSSVHNPWRERSLVPLYACNEQETGSQMHVRQLLHLAKALNRTLVLPNWGFGIPTISNCRPYAFDTIYETESTNSVGLWSVPYRVWLAWVKRVRRRSPLDARISVVFFRDTHKVLSESIANSDTEILQESCVPPEPFKIDDPPLYIATNGGTYMSSVVSHLRETDHLSTLFMVFNHYSDFRIKGGGSYPDPLLQDRPKEWGLWVGAPWPQWNYSVGVNTMFRAAQAKLPERYAAMQWRMELMPPKTLLKCSDLFAESVISGMRNMGLTTIYVASDMPLTSEKTNSKSASFNWQEVAEARESIDHLMYRLNEADFKVKTWNDIKPEDGDEDAIDGLAEGASGIFDKLILGDAHHLWGANPHCGFRSSFLGSIQTLRQDRIGNAQEEDWTKLGMTWVGEPIKERFWWHVTGEQVDD